MAQSEKSRLEMIAAIEQSFDVNSLHYRELMIWPLVRLTIYQQLLKPAKNYTRKGHQSNGKTPILTAQKEQIEGLRSYKNTDILFYSRVEEHEELIEGKFYDPYIDTMIDLVRDTHSFLKIERAADNIQETLPRFEPTIFINPMLLRYETDTTNSVEGFPDLQRVVLDISGIWIDETLCIEHARWIKAWQSFFAEILSEVGPKVVFIVYYHYLIAMGLVRACRKLNMTTVDIQHGRIDNLHGSYTYWTKIPPKGYDLLPDYYWCWGNSSKNGIEKWYAPNSACHRPVTGGNIRIAKWIEGEDFIINKDILSFYKMLKQKDKVILITMGHFDNPFPKHVCDAILRSPRNWLWLIRFHPNFRGKEFKDQTHSLFQQYGIHNYEIEYATSCPLYGLLKRVDHHLTLNSSAYYEALAFRVPTTIIDPTGLGCYEDDIKNGILAYADTSETLLASIEQGFLKQTYPSEYIETNRKYAENALETILNRSSQNPEGEINNAHTYNKLGESFINRGYKKAAFNSFLKAVEINPNLAGPYNNLGLLYWEAGEINNAFQYFWKGG